MSNPAASFEPYRHRLLGLAYRMLGRWLMQRTRCRRPTCAGMRSTAAKCRTRESVSHDYDDADLSRRALFGACAARRVRRSLAPEPVVDTAALAPDTRTELAEDLSIALLLTLPSCCTTCSISRSAKWPRHWSGARRPAGNWPPAHARTCAGHDHAAPPPRQRVRARSMRSTSNSCPPSWWPPVRAISMR
jgi:hypothetical protein